MIRPSDSIGSAWVQETSDRLLERSGSPEFDIVLVGLHDPRAALVAYEMARARGGSVGFYRLQDGLLSVSTLTEGQRVLAMLAALDTDPTEDALARLVSRSGAILVTATSLDAAT